MGRMKKKADGIGADLGARSQQQSPSWSERRTVCRSVGTRAFSINWQSSKRRPAWAAPLLALLALAGCQSAITNPANSLDCSARVPASGNGPSADLLADWPLRFSGHWFGTSCYSAYGCTIKYGNYWRAEPDDELKLSSASIGDKYPGT